MTKMRLGFAAATIAVAGFAAYTLHDIRAAGDGGGGSIAATIDPAMTASERDGDDAIRAEVRASHGDDDGAEIIAGTVPVAQVGPPPPPAPVVAPAVPDAMRAWQNPATTRPD